MSESDSGQLVSRADDGLLIGDEKMDLLHREFLDLHTQLLQTKGADFSARFGALLEHTRQHFAHEEQAMEATGFASLAEHKADHQRFLGELDRFSKRIAAGSTVMAKAWLKDQVPAWFELHVLSMDSALATHLAK
jgi:hemerythrin